MARSGDRRSSPALWGILVAGTMGLLALSSMGFWGVQAPLLKVRNHLFERFRLKVVRTDRIFGPVEVRGKTFQRVVGIELRLEDGKDQPEAIRRELACAAFEFFMNSGAGDDLQRVIIREQSGASTEVGRAELTLLQRARAVRDTLAAILLGEGLRDPKVEVLDAAPGGVSLEVSARGPENEQELVSYGSRYAKLVGQVGLVPVRLVRIRFSAPGKTYPALEYNNLGVLQNQEKPGPPADALKPAETPKPADSPDPVDPKKSREG